MNNLSFEYKPRKLVALFAVLLCSLLAFGAGYTALTHRHGIRINGLFRLGPGAADILLWAIFALMVFVLLKVLAALKNSFSGSRKIELNDGILHLPKSGSSNKVQTIRMVDIYRMEIKPVHKYKQLRISHRSGESTVHSAMMPSDSDFQILCAALSRSHKDLKTKTNNLLQGRRP
jgi:hypothetical protein